MRYATLISTLLLTSISWSQQESDTSKIHVLLGCRNASDATSTTPCAVRIRDLNRIHPDIVAKSETGEMQLELDPGMEYMVDFLPQYGAGSTTEYLNTTDMQPNTRIELRADVRSGL